MDVRGFILQSGYRVRSGTPVVQLYGRLLDGASFLVRDHRQRPEFHVRRADADAVRVATGRIPEPSDRRNFAGEPLCRIGASLPVELEELDQRLHQQHIATFEADVRIASRYLIDRGIRGGCRIRGMPVADRAARAEGVDLLFDDPELLPDDAEFEPRVLAFDIETDPHAERLLAISLCGLGADEVLIVDPANRVMPDRAIGCRDERDALRRFAARVAELDPDVLTGWNVVDFDLTVLERIAARLGLTWRLGRGDGPLRIRSARNYFGNSSATIPGRLVLDGIDLLRGAFVRMDEYGLDAVARRVLGEGKALHGSVADRAGEILHNHEHDLESFARYARTDARLALDIVNRLDLIRLGIARSRLTGLTPDRVAASIAAFDFLYLSELGRRGRAAPTLRIDRDRAPIPQGGGHVLEPRVGIHPLVWVFDFRSLYPSVIRTLNIDPLGFVDASTADEPVIRLDDGVAFRCEPGILPRLLDELMPRREAARRAGDAVAAQAIKILMNSFYGVLGTPACRFHNPAIANAITGLGRHFLLWARAWFEDLGYTVLYGDTDSLFVASGHTDPDAATGRAAGLVARFNAELAEYVRERWQRPSRLELQFEKLYLRLYLPSLRHAASGARKRYAGVVRGAAPGEVDFVGMEVVRRDWTDLAKTVQRELYQRLFADQPVDDYLAGVVGALRRGELDAQLVYRKGLRKPVESYLASTPPHVAAARKSGTPDARVVTYLMTTAGPEPLDALTAPPDREHYVERQIRPVAEPVLQMLGLEFSQVIGDDRQLGLF